MPYEMRKQGNQWCVFNKQTGDNKGCSDSEEKASAHMRALYAAESGSKDFDIEEILGIKSNTRIDQAKKWLTSLFSDEEDQFDGLHPIYLTKDFDGTTRAHIVFSNNFVDRHTQTIPEVVHQNTIEWLERTGIHPTFQIWHRGDKSRWGEADLVTRTGNFTVASGPVDKGKEAVAEALAKNKSTGVSNGYYALYSEDRKEFLAWYPFEVSALPAIASANIWMDDEHTLIQEGFLMTPEHKAILQSKGVDEKFITEMEADILSRSDQVTAAGVASKEVDGADAPITAEALVSVLQKVLEPINARFTALEEGQKALLEVGKKSKDDIVADEILGKIGQNPALLGYKATESNPTPDPNQDGDLSKDFNWLGGELDKLMKAGGVS